MNLYAATPWLWISRTLVFIGECCIIVWEALRNLFRHPREWKETVQQMAFIGVSSVPIVALTAMSYGGVLALYFAEMLQDYGAASLVGSAIALSMTREVAPILAGIMVAARCGSAIAAQIGTMAVTEQIEALRSLNVPPINYLVIPRLIAGTIMLPVLGLVGMYAGVVGGYFVAVHLVGVPDGIFMRSIRQFLELNDVIGGMAKTVVFGFITVVVACQQGLSTKGGAVGVGASTTRTVVITMVLIYVANYFLTDLIFR